MFTREQVEADEREELRRGSMAYGGRRRERTPTLEEYDRLAWPELSLDWETGLLTMAWKRERRVLTNGKR